MLTLLSIFGIHEDPIEKAPGKLGEYLGDLIATDTLHFYTAFSWLTLAVGLVLAYLVFNNPKTRKWIMRHMLQCALIVFSAGTFLYIIGFNGEGSGNNPMALLLRSLMASMEMFVSKSELIEVELEIKENPYYMLAFSIVHFLATCISAAFILHILGMRVKSLIKMRAINPGNWFRHNDLDLYIFFDLSQESVTLAKSIHKKKEKSHHRIIFVRTPMEESHHERFSFSHLLNLTDRQNGGIEDISDMDALLIYSRTGVNAYPNGAGKGETDKDASPKDRAKEEHWAENAGLHSLYRFISRRARNKYFFCLSPNEENNINTAITLRKLFPVTNSQDTDGNTTNIYCRAKRSSVTDFLLQDRIKVIDSASLSVNRMRDNVLYQPVRYVNPDPTTGIATKPFKAVIIGFGDTGQNVFKFLYEFSAMVYAKDISTPFECHIIDPQASTLQKELLTNCPGLAKDKGAIHFMSGKVGDFCPEMVSLIQEVDYIAVCTSDYRENLSLGIRMLNLAYLHREANRTLSILTGIYDPAEYAKATDIAEYYRSEATKGQQTTLYQFELVPFGMRDDLFTYDNIIDEDTVAKAIQFHHEYEKTKLYATGGHPKDTSEEEWNKRISEFLENGLSGRAQLTQQELQDIANVRHYKTKEMLMGITLVEPAKVTTKKEGNKDVVDEVTKAKLFKDTRKQEAICRVLTRMMHHIEEEVGRQERKEITDFDSYALICQELTEEEGGKYQVLLQNIAKCEHLRWVASNVLLGYTGYDDQEEDKAKKAKESNSKDYIRKKHACMVPNEELEKYKKLRGTIQYDYNTIWVGMKMENRQAATPV